MALPLLASGLPQFSEICGPCGFTCVCDFGAPGWGESRSAQCCVAFPSHGVRYGGLCDRCLVLFDRHFIQCYRHSFSTCVITEQLITLPSFVRFVFVCFCVFVCGWFVSCSASLFGLFGFFCWHRDKLIGLCTGPASVHFCSSPP